MSKAFAIFLLMAFTLVWGLGRVSDIELGNQVMIWLTTFEEIFDTFGNVVSAIGNFITTMIDYIISFFTWLFTTVQRIFCNIPFVSCDGSSSYFYDSSC